MNLNLHAVPTAKQNEYVRSKAPLGLGGIENIENPKAASYVTTETPTPKPRKPKAAELQTGATLNT